MSSEIASGRLKIARGATYCPRDRALMQPHDVGDATIDECPRCGGAFFDQGEMFAALGPSADPSCWDRPECSQVLGSSPIACPSCGSAMSLILVQQRGLGPYRGHEDRVEIDRCTRCGGLWLDHGEAERIESIGQRMAASIEAERAEAERELREMGNVDFGIVGAIARFLERFDGRAKPQ